MKSANLDIPPDSTAVDERSACLDLEAGRRSCLLLPRLAGMPEGRGAPTLRLGSDCQVSDMMPTGTASWNALSSIPKVPATSGDPKAPASRSTLRVPLSGVSREYESEGSSVSDPKTLPCRCLDFQYGLLNF